MLVKSMRCPNPDCSGHVVQKSGNSSAVRLRLKGALTFASDGLHGKCFWCSHPVVLPMELRKAIPKDRFTIKVTEKDLPPEVDESPES